jgi:beta-N-acetylhexosaminidase
MTPAAALAGVLTLVAAARPAPPALDTRDEKWVQATLRRLTLQQKAGQLVTSRIQSTFVSTDSARFDELLRLVRETGVGGFHLWGQMDPAPEVLLNRTWGTVRLGQPMEGASLVNRLQAASALPLLNTADFEAGVGQRLLGATVFPRAMAFAAAGDEKLAFAAGRITALEGRAIGVHVNFAPVVDVNNNPRNPVINTRSFGEDPAAVAILAAAYVRGLQAGGMLATLKHFPGHGDTDVDSHLGLATVRQPRARLDAIELPPFRAGMAAGAAAVMTGHIEMPALDPEPGRPASLSPPMVTGLLRGEMGFDGLVYTDALEMHAIADHMSPGVAAAQAIKAGNDMVLISPDDAAAAAGIREAVERGEIPMAQIDRSVERILRAKARLGLHRRREVDLDAIAAAVGTRAHAAVAQEVSRRAITLLKDERGQVPLRVGREAHVLYLSVLDYPAGWGIAAPGRAFIPALKERWPNVTAVEVSDQTTPGELDLVRAMTPRFDAIVVSVVVRTVSFSGRMDLAPPVAGLLRDLAAQTAATRAPLVAVLFGNPYSATFVPELPAMLLTYDYYDLAETSAVEALAGENAIGGRLPVALPGLFPVGHGLQRRAVRSPAPPPSPAARQ